VNATQSFLSRSVRCNGFTFLHEIRLGVPLCRNTPPLHREFSSCHHACTARYGQFAQRGRLDTPPILFILLTVKRPTSDRACRADAEVGVHVACEMTPRGRRRTLALFRKSPAAHLRPGSWRFSGRLGPIIGRIARHDGALEVVIAMAAWSMVEIFLPNALATAR